MSSDAAIPVLQLKAELLSEGCVQVETTSERSDQSWNPHGQENVFIKLSPTSRVRLRIASKSRLLLRREGTQLQLKIGDHILLSDAQLERVPFHCPNQISVCFYYECHLGCKFCPLRPHSGRSHPSKEQILEMMRDNLGTLQGVAFTYGIPVGRTSKEILEEIISVVRESRHLLGASMPIGVGPYACSKEMLGRLHEAGATEARINLETYDAVLFRRLCPNKNRESILRCLADAVEIFGRNRVSSNLILGIGESDSDVVNGVKALAQMGVVATLHPFNPFPSWEAKMRVSTNRNYGRPGPSRLLSLLQIHQDILLDHGLSTHEFKTTCPGCNACSLTPFLDSEG